MSELRCGTPGCAGRVLADGYCDTCGALAAAAAPSATPVARARRETPLQGRTTPAAAGGRCQQPGCGGAILADGYCDTCGTRSAPAAARPSASAPAISRPSGSFVTGSARSRGSRRTTSARVSSRSQRAGIGAGIVEVPASPMVDPASVVMATPEVAEDKRFCGACGSPVGRRKGNRAGRASGFCGHCRAPYDFVSKLAPRELVDEQYEVVGCLAHGGLGWIYLARDKAVNDRWCVLKGLLNAGDSSAMAAAVLERGFLAEVQHPNIVEIYNFVSHRGAGYIVMEYVGGPSLKQLLKERRATVGGRASPLPVDQALAYVLASLPAFVYLHGRGLLYCDFKPDNLIQVGDQVKLIDLGGVRRTTDTASDIYGTVGFQAPEVAALGPSVASDVYTLGRTLAVLTMDLAGYQSTFEHELPPADEHPALARFECFHRLLLKATAPHPDDRFQTVAELAEQCLGVLRAVVALSTGTAQPGMSAAFGLAPVDADLPTLRVDPGDPAAGFLADLPAADPAAAVELIAEAIAAGQITETVEVRLRRARSHLESGDHVAARAELERIEGEDPWEWRAVWLRGIDALAVGDLPAADSAFDRCMTEVPGELAPILAAALLAERAGDLDAATVRYDTAATVDPTFLAAVNGLARTRVAAGDVDGAVAAYLRVPATHRAHADALLGAARALLGAGRVGEASAIVDRVALDDTGRARIQVELLTVALDALATGATAADPAVEIHGCSLEVPSLRRGLERAYRDLAGVSPNAAERRRLVDEANRVRPRTVV